MARRAIGVLVVVGLLALSLRRTRALPVNDMLEELLCAVRDWLHGSPQEDDLTVVALRGL